MIRSFRLLSVIASTCLIGACALAPAQQPLGTRPPPAAAAAAGAGVNPAPSSSEAGDFPSLAASRTASVVDITTLRMPRAIGAGETLDLEISPEIDYADPLAWSVPTQFGVGQVRDLASGLILSSDGFILTSAHVVSDVDEVQVRLDDARRFNARIVGTDKRTDVALLKIDARNLPVAVIGDSSQLRPGDWVAAIGAPFGFHGTVTGGVVSAVDRYITGAAEIPFIQTDVAINPGSSGSPLYNNRGEVVAINSMIYSGNGGYMGLSFAVPINLAMSIAGELRSSGSVRRARLGAEFQEVSPALAQSFALPEASGALVVRVEPDSPAQAAGLVRGDVVSAIDGERILHFTELVRLLAQREPGVRSRLDVWRHGRQSVLWATLDEQRAPRIGARAPVLADWNDGLGLVLGELTPTLRGQMNIDSGLLVRESQGAARSEGIRAGDLIIAVNDTRLDHVDDFKRLLSHTPAGRTVALLVMRDRRLAYVPVRVPSEPRGK